MINFEFVGFDENLTQKVIAENQDNSCLLLFPTQSSKKEAKRLFLQNWNFIESEFLTMDEWKELLFPTTFPILKEEKRSLIFYKALSKDDNDFFNIGSYFQSIELSHNFFDFWEEIMEEQISDENIEQVLSYNQTAGNWQLKTFEQLKKIKSQYYHLLQKEKFTDKIFLHNIDEIQTDIKFNRIVVVNQFYFTILEKKILNKFDEEVLVYLQLPENVFDKGELKVLDYFDASMIKQHLKRKVKVIRSSEQFQMIACFLSEIDKNKNNTIIDFKFKLQSYSGFLSHRFFSISNTIPFTNTAIFRFFQITLDLLNSIVWKGKPFLLSLQQILNAALSNEFLSCFGQEKTRCEQIRTFLFELIDNDYQYLDLDYFFQNENEFKNEFEQLFKFLQKTQNIKSIKTLIEFINTEIDIENLVAEESRKTDVIKVFYELLADFASIEEIGIIPDWRSIFSGNITANILQLFLDYMKSKQTRYELDNVTENRIQITSLQDSRNLDFVNVYILNVIEGILPAVKHAQFLLSENQRSELGLKTYEDIKLRDKYYFYRLLACCENAVVFTRCNLEENIEVSSFIEELILHDMVEETDKSNEKNNLCEMAFSVLLNKNNYPLPNVDNISSDFFTIPHEQNDFPDNKLALSFYKWDKLKRNPFEYYIEYIAGLKARDPQVLNDFSSKLIGTISHNIFAIIWDRLIKVYQGNTIHHNFMYNTKDYVEQAVEHFLKYNKKLKYLSPYNYSENYFGNIFIPILKYGISNFFYRLHNDLQFTDKSISVFPETGKVTQKKFFDLDEIEISLRGRPDLRIHTTDDELYIFDYKTGSSNTKKIKKYNEQLQFYEFISYLIDSPKLENKLHSYLFFIEEKNMPYLFRRIDLKETITEVVQNIIENGFSLADSKDEYENIEVTRRDLKMKLELMK